MRASSRSWNSAACLTAPSRRCRQRSASASAYAKIVHFSDIIATDVPDDPHFARDLLSYFPDRMEKKYAAEIAGHRLRREIITRVLSNDLINRGGPAFVTRLQDATGRTVREIVRAFAIVRDGFGLPGLYRDIDALDNQIGGQVQLDLYIAVGRLLYAASAWDLKNGTGERSIGEQIAGLVEALKVLEPKLLSMLPQYTKDRIEARSHGFSKTNVPDALADRLAMLDMIELIPDIVLVARMADAARYGDEGKGPLEMRGADLLAAGRAFFAVSEAFRISRIEEAAHEVSTSDYYDGLALSRGLDMIAAARRGIAVQALTGFSKSADPVAEWLKAGGERIAKVRDRLVGLTEGGDITVSRLTVAAGLMADLTGV
jgi:glutamate dehydrogenase